MYIIGTAGHVDHGKSALVRALTGIDPDRLPEEKERGMTIDLGFAWLPLSSGEVAGIIDVPGHKDLIRNVLAGVWGINAVLLVVAADDGWMPQTEEHLQILNQLHLENGIVVLTKVDLIDDPDWLDLVQADIQERLKGTRLSHAPIVKVSAKEGTNIKELRESIEGMLPKIALKRDIGKPCLPIDRAFTIKGSGTVVTGTLVDGSLSRGDKVIIFPMNLHTRIRGLESYKEKTDKGQPGERVALNLVGIEKEALKRGDMVFGAETQVRSSTIIDTKVDIISQIAHPIKNNTELAVYLGPKEIFGRIMLFGRKNLGSGESAFACFRFKEPLSSRIGDRFIIRRLSPTETIGGGTVLDPLAVKHKLKDMDKVIQFLQGRMGIGLEELIMSELDKSKYVMEEELLVASHYSASEISSGVRALQKRDKLILIGSWVIDSIYWQKQGKRVLAILAAEHSLYPLRNGLLQAELQERLSLPRELFRQLIATLIDLGRIVRDKDTIALSTHKPSLSPEQELVVSRILELFERNRINLPTKMELAIQITGSEEIIRFMCQQNMLVEVPEGVLFEGKHYEAMKFDIIDFLKRNGTVSIQQLRELIGLSRKYILPLLSKLDQEGVTQRIGDERVLATA